MAPVPAAIAALIVAVIIAVDRVIAAIAIITAVVIVAAIIVVAAIVAIAAGERGADREAGDARDDRGAGVVAMMDSGDSAGLRRWGRRQSAHWRRGPYRAPPS
jgi:hypothetical protein